MVEELKKEIDAIAEEYYEKEKEKISQTKA